MKISFVVGVAVTVFLTSLWGAAQELDAPREVIIPLNVARQELVVVLRAGALEEYHLQGVFMPRSKVQNEDQRNVSRLEELCLMAFVDPLYPPAPGAATFRVASRKSNWNVVSVPLETLADFRVREMTDVPLAELEWMKPLLSISEKRILKWQQDLIRSRDPSGEIRGILAGIPGITPKELEDATKAVIRDAAFSPGKVPACFAKRPLATLRRLGGRARALVPWLVSELEREVRANNLMFPLPSSELKRKVRANKQVVLCEAIARMGASASDAIPVLIAQMQKEKDRHGGPSALASALVAIGPDSIGALKRVLHEDPEASTRSAAANALAKIGGEALDVLREALDSKNEDVSNAVAQRLRYVWMTSEFREFPDHRRQAIAGILRDHLDDPRPSIRRVAAEAAPHWGRDPGATGAKLLTQLADRDRGVLNQALRTLREVNCDPKELNARLRPILRENRGDSATGAALYLIEQRGPLCAELVPEIRAGMGKNEVPSPRSYLEALAAIGGPEAALAVEEVRPLVFSKDGRVAYSAVKAISGMGPDGVAALDDMLELLREGVEDISKREWLSLKCRCAAAALGGMGPAAKKALPDLLPYVVDPPQGCNSMEFARAMGAIDLDEAITLIREVIPKDVKPGIERNRLRQQEAALAQLLLVKADAEALREAFAKNRPVEWPDPDATWPKHLGRWHGNGHDGQGNWWDLLLRSRTLRPGDSLERLMVQLRRPMKMKDGELEYLELSPSGRIPRLRRRFVVHTGAEGVRRVLTLPMQ